MSDDVEAAFKGSLQAFREGGTGSPTGTSVWSYATRLQQNVGAAVTSTLGGLQPLATTAQQTVSTTISGTSSWSTMTFQRGVTIVALLGAAAICFSISVFSLPFIIIMPGKFALTLTVGSLLVMAAMAVYTGPLQYFKALFSSERLVFTTVYLFSSMATLYASLIAKSYLLSLTFGFVQVVAIAWYVASYLPGGVTAFSSMGNLLWRGTRSVLPI